MIALLYIIGAIYGLIALFELYLIIGFRVNKSGANHELKDWPQVSLLVCARNEEVNLRTCIESLLQLDYPKDKFQILIGNDNSTDKTSAIISEFENQSQQVIGISIEHEKEGLIAKGNVLNQLIDQTQHEYQVIIDADMQVSEQWLKQMVSALHEYDMISGYTQISRQGRWSQTQYFDWQIVLHSMKAMADSFRPISILGNNMGFRKSSYDRVGGFRALGPTDVEDLGLPQRFQKHGLNTGQLILDSGEAYTKPQMAIVEMIEQRCRWMNGVFTHHWLLAIPAFFARLWFVIAACAFLVSPYLSLLILTYGIGFNYIKYLQITSAAKSQRKSILLEPIFISLLDTFALLRISILGKVSWKGRKF